MSPTPPHQLLIPLPQILTFLLRRRLSAAVRHRNPNRGSPSVSPSIPLLLRLGWITFCLCRWWWWWWRRRRADPDGGDGAAPAGEPAGDGRRRRRLPLQHGDTHLAYATDIISRVGLVGLIVSLDALADSISPSPPALLLL
jgi:hypothetical protein